MVADGGIRAKMVKSPKTIEASLLTDRDTAIHTIDMREE